MELTEFILKRERMLNALGRTGGKCCGVKCDECPLFPGDVCSLRDLEKVRRAEEIVRKWDKEHPLVTNRMKFEEVFGVHVPKTHRAVIFNDDKLYWDEEYRAPEKVRSDNENI